MSSIPIRWQSRRNKELFPKAQLFSFTGTPIFENNSTYKQIDGTISSYRTTKDVFQQELHAYTITNAIDDGNVLRFHIDYFKPDDVKKAAKAASTISKSGVKKLFLQNTIQLLTTDVTMLFLLHRVLMRPSNILNYLKNFKKSGKRRIVVLNLLILLVFFSTCWKPTKM